jgi:hypothetical protein
MVKRKKDIKLKERKEITNIFIAYWCWKWVGSFSRRWFVAFAVSEFQLVPTGCNVHYVVDNCIEVLLAAP